MDYNTSLGIFIWQKLLSITNFRIRFHSSSEKITSMFNVNSNKLTWHVNSWESPLLKFPLSNEKKSNSFKFLFWKDCWALIKIVQKSPEFRRTLQCRQVRWYICSNSYSKTLYSLAYTNNMISNCMARLPDWEKAHFLRGFCSSY